MIKHDQVEICSAVSVLFIGNHCEYHKENQTLEEGGESSKLHSSCMFFSNFCHNYHHNYHCNNHYHYPKKKGHTRKTLFLTSKKEDQDDRIGGIFVFSQAMFNHPCLQLIACCKISSCMDHIHNLESGRMPRMEAGRVQACSR